MSAPIALPSDLETFLGMASGTIDVNRATQLLAFAQAKCERVVSPIPATALDIVVGCAARGFSNPEGVLTETVGPYTVQRGASNLYLTRQERSDLKRIAGRGGAFSIDILPLGTSAVQLITITGAPTGGTFTLSFAGQLSAPIPYNASALDIQNALGLLSIISAGNISVSGTGPFTVSFVNALATTPVPTIVGNGTNLTGGTKPTVGAVSIVDGVYAPGQNLASWDRDNTFFSSSSILGQ